GSSLDGGRELVRESAPKQLANSRANSCCRHPHASTSSRDIAARSVRAISFRRGSNRRGTKTVESRSNPSASPNSPLTPSPIPPHATDENGGCERLPLNSFAADLSPVLRRYFSSTGTDVKEISEKAYVSSSEITEYDRVLEALLRDRLSVRKDTIVQSLATTRHRELHVEK